MSVVFVVVPAVTAGWPVIAALIGAACAGIGYTARKVAEEREIVEAEQQAQAGQPVAREIELEMGNSEVIGEILAREQSIQLEKDGVIATFSKDARGALRLHVHGERTRQELAAIGQQLLNRVRQQFAYEKVKGELTSKGFTVVEEHVDESNNIRLSVRRFG